MLSSLQSQGYGYIAVSHVWDNGAEVDDELNNMTIIDELDIDVTAEDGEHLDNKPISWLGLRQVAHAANRGPLGPVNYFWLDYLCLDQVDKNNDMEKGLQICIMGDIYRNAHAVVTMIGGIPSVQSVSTPSAWMDRAWTLQEAILNKNVTWIYVKWSTNPSHLSIQDPKSSTKWRFYPVGWTGGGLRPGEDLCLVRLRHLLDLSDAQPLSNPPYPANLPEVVVLNGMTHKAGDVPRRALRACLSFDSKVRYTGVWRSMFMRTSSKPVDVVYSIMAIFNIQIRPPFGKIHVDPYRKNRDPEFVFNDLARKTAARGDIGPVWLTIGGIAGSSILRNPHSQIIPKFPHTEGANVKSNNAPPKMGFGKRWEWTGFHTDDSPFYIPQYDIQFLTHSHPHVISATMLHVKYHKVKSTKSIPQGGEGRQVKRTVASIRLRDMLGKCTYAGKIPHLSTNPDLYGLYIGQVEDMTRSGSKLNASDIVEFGKTPSASFNFSKQRYLLFINWNDRHRRWEYAADGIFKPKYNWRPPSRRYMLTVGTGAQKRFKRWPVPNSLRRSINPNNLDFRLRKFHHSYGIEPLPDFRYHPASKQVIRWGYNKSDYPTGNHPVWSKRYVHYNIRKFIRDKDTLAEKLATPSALSALSARSSHPPDTITESTQIEITNDGHAVVPYNYDGWSRSACSMQSLLGVDGILFPNTNSHKGRIPYWVRIWFGEWVMYVQIKFHRKTPKEFWQIAVVPYRRRGIGGFVANEDSIEDPPLSPPYPYSYGSTTSSTLYPIYQPVVPIVLPMLQGSHSGEGLKSDVGRYTTQQPD
ncbi:hypothetical protein G7Z17_g197 [Cylindrodendrum hubeiense]|uniref:Heterokaryon incompatibility domain-containing protein n=1 Tax=Cylindrodendrum hubeiense TaxID=595255 RepID=A0A9P5HM97_9HYPO|nr:hypothetical protein G7Z17_g197 [Cylindrodendrum hubeiense]